MYTKISEKRTLQNKLQSAWKWCKDKTWSDYRSALDRCFIIVQKLNTAYQDKCFMLIDKHGIRGVKIWVVAATGPGNIVAFGMKRSSW